MRIVLIYIFTLLANNLFAQQYPHFSQYMLNLLAINPGYAGSHKDGCSSLLYKKQWIDFNGAPTIQSFNFHFPINYQRMGLGVQILNESIVAENHFEASISYAYKINFGQGILSLGLNGGLRQSIIDISQIHIKDRDDAYLSQSNYSTFIPDAATGLYYKDKRFSFGVSAIHLFQNHIQYFPGSIAKQRRHCYLTGSYQFTLSPSLDLKPLLLLKYISFAPIQADIGCITLYKNIGWAGISYRTNDALSCLIGVNVNTKSINISLLKIGYSYDITLSKLSSYTKGTHEFLIIAEFEDLKSAKKIIKKRPTKSPLFF